MFITDRDSEALFNRFECIYALVKASRLLSGGLIDRNRMVSSDLLVDHRTGSTTARVHSHYSRGPLDISDASNQSYSITFAVKVEAVANPH
jgi:hypothetical protein